MLDRRLAEPDIGGVEQNLVQRSSDFRPGQHRAKAVMSTASAKSHVRVGISCDVEVEGLVEHILVAIGRAKHRHNAGTLLDRRVAEHNVPGGAAHPEYDRSGPAQHFLYGT